MLGSEGCLYSLFAVVNLWYLKPWLKTDDWIGSEFSHGASELCVLISAGFMGLGFKV